MDSNEYDEQGRKLFLNGRYEESLETFREGLRRFPGDEDLELGIGMCQARLGNVIPAVETLEGLRRRSPDWGDVLLGLTDAYLKLGRVTAAREMAAEAVKTESDDPSFIHEVARLFFDHRRFVEAEALYRRASEQGEPYPPAHLGLGACLHRQGNLQGAEKAIREAIRIDPEYWPACQYLGNLLYELDRKQEAREVLERVPLDVTWHRLALERLVTMSPQEQPKRRKMEQMLQRSPRRAGKTDAQGIIAQLEQRWNDKK
ncbi:MAG: tetratricopeptide repeat protein [Elusimicrobia bacterium]|nr:tetratricopeptide repeat protein [Elusimicrobiota bacterium]